jgi:hypothetical protein
LLIGCTKHTFIQSAGTEVQAQVGLRADFFTPLHELVCPEGVRLDTDPSKLRSGLVVSSYALHYEVMVEEAEVHR